MATLYSIDCTSFCCWAGILIFAFVVADGVVLEVLLVSMDTSGTRLAERAYVGKQSFGRFSATNALASHNPAITLIVPCNLRPSTLLSISQFAWTSSISYPQAVFSFHLPFWRQRFAPYLFTILGSKQIADINLGRQPQKNESTQNTRSSSSHKFSTSHKHTNTQTHTVDFPP